METTHSQVQPSKTMTTWTMDPMHSSVCFSVRHLMITNARGEFQLLGGTVRLDPARPEAAEIHVELDAASIHTRVAQRDAHLRSPEFFDVERFPKVVFRSTRVKAVPSGGLTVEGELTLRGTTRPVVLEVHELSGEQKDHNGVTRRGASAVTKIKRSDFGMTYNRVLEAGALALSDDVTLTLDVSLVKAP